MANYQSTAISYVECLPIFHYEKRMALNSLQAYLIDADQQDRSALLKYKAYLISEIQRLSSRLKEENLKLVEKNDEYRGWI